jgi:hypothetical protein
VKPYSIQSTRVLKQLGALFVLAILVIGLLQFAAPGIASSRVDSRLNRLESESSLIRARLNRLETQLSRANRGSDVDLPEINLSDGAVSSPLADDPMFDRLATLVIEQRERIDQLEARIAALERSRPTQPQ